MKKAILVIFFIFTSLAQAWAYLADYTRRDSRLNVFPILKPYDQILGYQTQALKWDKSF